MKNILLIIPNLTIGGAQKSFTNLSLELAKEYNVFVVHFGNNKQNAYKIGGELISLNVDGGGSFIGKVVNFLSRINKLRKIKKEKNIHTSISFLEGADYINILSGGNDKKIISIRGSKCHDVTIRGGIGWLRKKLFIPLLYPKADHIVVVNEGIKRELTEEFKIKEKNISIIHNYYDLNKIKSLSTESIDDKINSEKTSPYLISFGRIAPEKNISFLIEVFAQIIKKLPQYRLLIVGEGPSYPSLCDKCEELNIAYNKMGEAINSSSRILFIGSDSNPFKYASKASLFIMTSSSEGFPNALAESMICGTPVISTDCPWGPREILSPKSSHVKLTKIEHGEFGFLMPEIANNNTSNVNYWSSTIIDLLNNNVLLENYSQRAIERMTSFSSDMMLKKWSTIIEKTA